MSNVSFSFRGNDPVREAIHTVFLYHAIQAGMTMGIVNAGMLGVCTTTWSRTCGRRSKTSCSTAIRVPGRPWSSCPDRQGRQAKGLGPDLTWREQSGGKRLEHALVKGITDFVVADTEGSERQTGSAGPRLWPSSKARSWRHEPRRRPLWRREDVPAPGGEISPRDEAGGRPPDPPFIEAEKARTGIGSKGKILMATVKGDVTTSARTSSASCSAATATTLIDLGVMVPCENILHAAREHKADIIGLSGLITPSLEEMAHVAAGDEAPRIHPALLIGGATTSRAHTAIKIATNTDSPVVYVPDASRPWASPPKLLSAEQRQVTWTKSPPNTRLCALSTPGAKGATLVSRRRPGPIVSRGTSPTRISPCRRWSAFVLSRYRPRRARAVHRLDPFFQSWELAGRYPAILESETVGETARQLFDDARRMLTRIIEEQWLCARAVFGLWPAAGLGDDIVFTPTESRNMELGRWVGLRQQHKQPAGRRTSPCRFRRPARLLWRLRRHGRPGNPKKPRWPNSKPPTTTTRPSCSSPSPTAFAEAAAEWLPHQRVRQEFWAYAADESLTNDELIAEAHISIRPALAMRPARTIRPSATSSPSLDVPATRNGVSRNPAP